MPFCAPILALTLLMTCGLVAAVPVDLLISTSPDQKFEAVLIGERTGNGEPAYFRMAIRDLKDKKELPLPEGGDMVDVDAETRHWV